MTNNKLLRHRCTLIQSGIFKNNIINITGRNSIIDLNYMGAAEFEWDALALSTQRMLTNIDFYDVFTFPQYFNDNGDILMVYAPKMFIKHISQITEDLLSGKLNRFLKEWCTLSDYLNGTIKNYNYADFWWDIDNDFYIFFGEKNKELILEAQRVMREKSINDVEVGNWDELSQYYLISNQDLDDNAKDFLKSKNNQKRLTQHYDTY